MASFAEFTAAPASLTTWSQKVPTDLGRAAELELLRDELAAIEDSEGAAKEAGTARARKAAEGVNPRIPELKAVISDLEKVLEESEASVTLTVIPIGEWLQFCEDHPAAEEGTPAYDFDLAYGRDAVSVSATQAELGKFITGWNGEPIPRGAWTIEHTNKIPPANVMSMIQSIVDHHHRAVILPKSSSASSKNGTSATN